ncbi:unnamed protein product [Durusdinium trenchii]|uniref:ParB/Sulfiredoxin domain-containing protein n=2 Tax=Durusdinium trenchii TaxID=1381693 RepID=A0ABP0H5H7_9DINO
MSVSATSADVSEEWSKSALVPGDIHRLELQDGSHVLALRCRPGKEKLKPWKMAKQLFISQLGEDAMAEADEDEGLRREVAMWKKIAKLEVSQYSMEVRGFRAVGLASNRLGYERAAFLALAVTVALGRPGTRQRGDMHKLKLQVQRVMSSGIAASAAPRTQGRLACVQPSSRDSRVFRTVKKWHTKCKERKKQEDVAKAQREAAAKAEQEAMNAAMPKRQPRPPFHALSEDVQPKAMPRQAPQEARAKSAPFVPVKAMPVAGRGVPASKASPSLKQELEEVKVESSDDDRMTASPSVKQELEEVKVESSDGEKFGDDMVSDAESEPRHLKRTPQVQEFLRHAQRDRDWDPASPKFDESRWGNYVQKINCEELRWTHASIADRFRSGPHRNLKLESLTDALVSGRISVDDVPALVGVQDEGGIVWIVSGNRRLWAIRRFAEHLQASSGAMQAMPCVQVRTLVFSLADMDSFPQSLFARCVEAFSGNGERPTLRVPPALAQPARTAAPLPMASMPAPRGSLRKRAAFNSLEGEWTDQTGAMYRVTSTSDIFAMQVLKSNGRTYRVHWDEGCQAVVWPSSCKHFLACPRSNDIVDWHDQDGRMCFTWQRKG